MAEAPYIPPRPTLLAVDRDQPGGPAWMEQLIPRIRAMSHRQGGNPEALINQVWSLFAQHSPALGLWVAVDQGDPIGHALAVIDQFDGRYVGWVTQVEMDTIAAKILKDDFLTALENWVHNWNALINKPDLHVREILMSSTRGTESDAWARHAGFQTFRTIFRREIR